MRQLNEEFQTLKETYNDVQSQLANEVIKVAGISAFYFSVVLYCGKVQQLLKYYHLSHDRVTFDVSQDVINAYC